MAPFNSTESESFDRLKKKIRPLMVEKQDVLRLGRLCREVDRQYEFNNNGQLDNGVYHKKPKNEVKDGSFDEDDDAKFAVLQCS